MDELPIINMVYQKKINSGQPILGNENRQLFTLYLDLTT